MCGRFVSTSSVQELTEFFGATHWPTTEALAPNWNTAPTDGIWAALQRVDRETGELTRQLRAVRWGLVPSWAKDPGIGARMINARAETVHEKPAFRKAFATRRCLIPADGYYEWRPVPAAEGRKAHKQPYYLSPASGSPMAMAGLYEFWRNGGVPEDDPAAWLTTATIITTDATDTAGLVHDRMPLTIAGSDFDAWLDPEHTDTDELRHLLHTPAGELTVRAVSTAVNNVRNDGSQLLDPAPDPLGVTGPAARSGPAPTGPGA
ncbi:SOS response-associated peptidase [Kitasatospora sp. NBC_00315]|uniref:SOS response-associated peptidase n=1 Tax=Kitasatospora sp. NBC_00315 TaxID=2975963 RepID=UPI00324D971B